MPDADLHPPRGRATSELSYQFLNYRGLTDLERALQHIALRLPTDVELVVGIPRSGLLAASILALQLNLPLTDVAGYLEDRRLAAGRRPRRRVNARGGRVVIVDDSVNTGGQLRGVREKIGLAGRAERVLYAAPFVTRRGVAEVDLHGEVVDQPRIFAWNILHHPELLARSCVDIDGVLCLDPTELDNDDGPRYRQFLGRAQPLFLPTAPVGYVVTSRLERYRPETERWLRDNGVEYGQLVMLDLESAAERRAAGAHARHKAEFYVRSGAQLFVESDYGQAVEIAARSGLQVFAVDRREMVYPSPRRALAAAPDAFVRSVGRLPPAQALLFRSKAAAAAIAGPRGTAIAKRALRGDTNRGARAIARAVVRRARPRP
jgi:uncharacterized HAD superfamily protein/hypoxanthine phosphoribosyltransferase